MFVSSAAATARGRFTTPARPSQHGLEPSRRAVRRQHPCAAIVRLHRGGGRFIAAGGRVFTGEKFDSPYVTYMSVQFLARMLEIEKLSRSV